MTKTYDVRIDECLTELDAEMRAKLGLVKGDKQDAVVTLSVMEYTPTSHICVGTIEVPFVKSDVRNTDAFNAMVKAKAEEMLAKVVQEAPPSPDVDLAEIKGRTVKL